MKSHIKNVITVLGGVALFMGNLYVDMLEKFEAAGIGQEPFFAQFKDNLLVPFVLLDSLSDRFVAAIKLDEFIAANEVVALLGSLVIVRLGVIVLDLAHKKLFPQKAAHP